VQLIALVGASKRRSRALGVLAILALVGAAVVPVPALAATPPWTVNVGAQTKDGAIQANFFMPGKISIDVGDTINWSADTGEIHTVSFLSGGDRPGLFTTIGNPPTAIAPNPVVFAPAGPDTYDGTGYRNSGVIAGGAIYSLTFTKVGTFEYVCLVHKDMVATVKVSPAGTKNPVSRAGYELQSRIESAQRLGEGRALAGIGRAAAAIAGPRHVTAGVGELFTGLGSLAVMRFEPDRKVIRAGETVTWTNRDPETPHTVTFGEEPPGSPLGAFAPSGTDGAGHATISTANQAVNSGFLAGAGNTELPLPSTFQVKFTTPGTYAYICALHDELGMIGTITVT